MCPDDIGHCNYHAPLVRAQVPISAIEVAPVSMNYTVFIKDLPSRLEWQNYLDQAEIPLKLMESLEVNKYSGFVPMELAGYEAGVEIYLDEFDPNYIPEANEFVGDRKKVITFSFSSDTGPLCCAAAAVLARFADGLIYFDVIPQSYEQTMTEFYEFLPDAKIQLDPTKHKALLAILAQKLAGFALVGNALLYLPLGDCARGVTIVPDSRFEDFQISILVWPLVAHTEHLLLCSCPTGLNIEVSSYYIYQPSTGRCSWNYDDPGAASEIIDLATNNLVPYFESINTPLGLADALFEQFRNEQHIYDIEKTGMACAAAGKYDEALIMFDRVMAQSNPNLQFDWKIAIEERCTMIAELIKENRVEEIGQQLAEWRTYTINKCGLASLVNIAGSGQS